MDEFMVVNDADGNADSYGRMAFIFADNASEKKLKKWGLRNTRKED
jgi:hypothetical protein